MTAQEPTVVACEPLKISYKDPLTREPLTEDVFLDPRDSWCDGGSVILVSAASVKALQENSEKERQHTKGSQNTADGCRRDYLREQRYLIEELEKMMAMMPSHIARSMQEVIDNALARIEDIEENTAEPLEPEVVNTILDKVGHRTKEDDELLDFFKGAGIDTSDELNMRILLKKMHAEVDTVKEERDRMRKVLDGMDGGGDEEKIIDALMAAATADGKTLCDLVCAVRDYVSTEKAKREIEDIVTRNLRERYEKLLEKYGLLEPKVQQWRDRLAGSEMRQAKIMRLNEEVADAEEQLAEKIALEEAPTEIPRKFISKYNIWDKMTPEEQAKLEKTEEMVERLKNESRMVSIQLSKVEEKVESIDGAAEKFRDRCRNAEEDMARFEAKALAAESRLHDAEQEERDAAHMESEAMAAKEFQEEEVEAQTSPPPKQKDLRNIEQEVEDARRRTEELLAEEDRLVEKKMEYEERYEHADLAWRALQEERAAEALAALQAEKTETGEAPSAPPRHSDPLMLEYYERFSIPDVLRQGRHMALHTDTRARERKMREKRMKAAEEEAERVLACIAAQGPPSAIAFSAPDPSVQVPVTFRRPEDLRVRLAGAEQTVGLLSDRLAERSTHSMALAEELRGLGHRLAECAAESGRLHCEAREQLVHNLATAESNATRPAPSSASALREDLLAAAQNHQMAADEAAAAWSVAEQACQRGIGEAELNAEASICMRREENLTSAVQGLYRSASRAATEGPSHVAGPARKCCADLEAVEVPLAAVSASRGSIWPRALKAAGSLDSELSAQEGLKVVITNENRRMGLLAAERMAPAEAKRAIAVMRAGTTSAPNASPTKEANASPIRGDGD